MLHNFSINKFFLLITCLISFASMQGQSIPWFALNGSDPVRSIQLNPAFQSAQDLTSSIHIGGINIDYANNFGHFKNKSFLQLPFNINNISVPELQYKKNGIPPGGSLEREVSGFEMKLNPSNINDIYFSTSLMYSGPGYFKKASDDFSWGVISGAEFHGGINNFPDQITYEYYKSYREGNIIQVPLWNAIGYGYFYVGVNGSKSFELPGESKISLGLNLKYLGGLAYMSLENAENIESYSFEKNEDVVVSNLLLNYAYTHGSEADISDPLKGSGVGADVGIYYSKKLKSKQIRGIRGGISVKNFGFINFNDALRKGSLEINEPTGISFKRIDSTTSIDQFVDSARLLVTSKPLNRVSETRGHTIMLPSQFNFNMTIDFNTYANVHLLYSMPLSRYSPEAIQIGFMPELKLNKVNIMVPFSYSQWTGFRLGAGINLDFLTFGTDDVRSFLKRDKLESGSVYLGVNIKKFKKRSKN